jgi:hypothetical protein
VNAEVLAIDSPRWHDMLMRLPHDTYHLPGYAKVSELTEGGEALAFACEDEGGGGFLAPFIMRRLDAERYDVVSPFGYSGPLCQSDDPGFLARAVRAFVGRLRTAGVVSGFFRLHPLLALDLGVLGHHGEVVLVGDTVWIDLTLPEAEMWRQTRENHRRDIQRAEREGFTTYVDAGEEALPEFCRAYRETMDRVGARSHYYLHDDYFRELRARLGDALHLLVVEHAGRVAAAALFMECGGIVQYHLGGSISELLPYAPMKLLFHFARTWFRGRGNQVLHLGGGVGGRRDSLFHFKCGFGEGRAQFCTWRVIFDRDAYAGLVAAWERRHDRQVPTGFFPAYRTPTS